MDVVTISLKLACFYKTIKCNKFEHFSFSR